MGGTRMNASDWDDVSTTMRSQTAAQIFRQTALHQLHDDLAPLKIKVRESCDSPANPNSTPIMVGTDVTGSMGALAEVMVKEGLGTLILETYKRKPVDDPHLLVAALGDEFSDQAPLQVTQFEADVVLADQLSKFWIEGNGGGNRGESYWLLWAFAATKTRCDAIIKRKQKGFIFTIGDECPHGDGISGKGCSLDSIKRIIGPGPDFNFERDMTAQELLKLVSQSWEVFHLMVNTKHHRGDHDANRRWKALLGERAIELTDHTKMAEVIVSILEVVRGRSVQSVVDSWSGSTALVVANAVKDLATAGGSKGVVRL